MAGGGAVGLMIELRIPTIEALLNRRRISPAVSADTGDQLGMVARGGDQDVSYASLLFGALWCDDSVEGQEISQDHETLYKHWRRLDN